MDFGKLIMFFDIDDNTLYLGSCSKNEVSWEDKNDTDICGDIAALIERENKQTFPFKTEFASATFTGISIFTVGKLPKQIRFPRSKKNRIQKKWSKDSKNWVSRDAFEKGTILKTNGYAKNPWAKNAIYVNASEYNGLVEAFLKQGMKILEAVK